METQTLPNRSATLVLAAWRPLWLLGALAAAALAVPVSQRLLHPWPSGASGIDIDTSGARATMEGGRFTLRLPLAVGNHSENMVRGVSLWVEAYACPAGASVGHGCQRVLSAGQEHAMSLAPGASGSWTTQLEGALPDGLVAERIEVVRRLDGVEETSDASRARARGGV